MNKNIKLAVAGAIFAAASAAQAGIVIPAGDWTLDVSGNVNIYDTYAHYSGGNTVAGGLVGSTPKSYTQSGMTNGLLPNFLSFSGTTRQNDLDVSFTISLQPGSGVNGPLQQVPLGSAAGNNINDRQMFITFGDKSWGSVKLGKDLGIFASDAILSDMTLLGVGGVGPGVGSNTSGGNTTLGRIGAGYIYADWKPQIAYTTPNFSGFQATAGISQAFNAGTLAGSGLSAIASKTTQSNPAYEGKASYSFAQNDVTGKVWVSGIAQHANIDGAVDPMAYAGDVGVKLAVSGAEVVGYYYSGDGIGTTGQMLDGYSVNSGDSQRKSYGGYVQATYVLPTKTKVGVSWGESNLDKAATDVDNTLVKSNEMWTAGVYHPLTKHLNLVAEYSHMKAQNQQSEINTANIGSLGAILFF